jgi:hypothetical protein
MNGRVLLFEIAKDRRSRMSRPGCLIQIKAPLSYNRLTVDLRRILSEFSHLKAAGFAAFFFAAVGLPQTVHEWLMSAPIKFQRLT